MIKSMNELKKNVFIIDIWILCILLFIGLPGYRMWLSIVAADTLTTSGNEVPVISIMVGFVVLLSTCLFVFLCSRLKKTRYLIIYLSCTKVSNLGKVFVGISIAIAGLIQLIEAPVTGLILVPYTILTFVTSVRTDERFLEYLEG